MNCQDNFSFLQILSQMGSFASYDSKKIYKRCDECDGIGCCQEDIDLENTYFWDVKDE